MKLLLQRLFSRYHWSITITYALTFIENILELLYPFIIVSVMKFSPQIYGYV